MKLAFKPTGHIFIEDKPSLTGTVYTSECGEYVVIHRVRPSPLGNITWLSCRRADRQPLHDWRVKQAIKNAFAGAETEGCELYPADSRLVDTSNQYHIWCLPPGMAFPFGFDERLVISESVGNAVQRPFNDEEAKL